MKRFSCLHFICFMAVLFLVAPALAVDFTSNQCDLPLWLLPKETTHQVSEQVEAKIFEPASVETFVSTGESTGIILSNNSVRLTFLSAAPKVANSDVSSLPVIAKQKAENEPVSGNAIISAAFTDYFYIETDNRECGIRVTRPNHGLSAGIRADINGIVKTNSDGERYIDASSAVENGSGSVTPLAMSNCAVGGGDWFYNADTKAGQKGIVGASDLNNIGLLIRTTGLVTYRGTGYFYVDDGSSLDDGSGHRGIKVIPYDGNPPLMESYVQVTGISSCYGGISSPQRQVRAINSTEGARVIQSPTSTTWFWDINGVNNADSIPTWTTALNNLSISWIRMGWDMAWSTVEPQKGQWTFSELDTKILTLENAGFKILPILCYTADWAVGPAGIFGPALHPADWETYVRTIVSRYIGPPYNIKYWQVWNEPTIQAWWDGSTNLDFIDQVYLPAAQIIRELGGYVVFGGWPISNTLSEFESEMNYHNAWQYTDYLSIHYNTPINMQTLYNNWVANGKVKGIWQTEIGWFNYAGYVPNLYPRVLRWSVGANAKEPDMVKLFWYASWADPANASKCFMGGPRETPTITDTHGIRLRTLGNIFAGAPVHVRTDITSNPIFGFNLNHTVNSLEAFSVGGRTIVVVHELSSYNYPQITLSWPATESPSRVRRITTTGTEQDLTFSWDGAQVSVTVPLSDIVLENTSSSRTFRMMYVVADPPV